MVSLTPADSPTHLLPGHAGVGAGVVGLATNVLAVLVGVVTSHSGRTITRSGNGQHRTLNAHSINRFLVTASPWRKAALHILIERLYCVRSAVTWKTLIEAQIPAHDLISVVAGIRVGGHRDVVTQVSCPYYFQSQQLRDDYGHYLHLKQYWQARFQSLYLGQGLVNFKFGCHYLFSSHKDQQSTMRS